LKKLSISIISLGLFSSAISQASEKLGSGGLLVPPIFDSKASAKLVDTARNLSPSQKPLEVVSTNFKNGDILFIRSTSVQSKALEEVTRSKWTHVGIVFRIKSTQGVPTLVPSNSKEGLWVVYEAGPRVRFTPVERFVAGRAFATLRLKEGLVPPQEKLLFTAAVSRIGNPYDIYFLLSRDGQNKDDLEYCSELVWYVYQKALGINLGFQVKIGSQKLDGPEAEKLMKERFNRADAPLTVGKWKEQYVIPPESQFVSPLLKRVDMQN
jgi:Permuted papain-like amidase enzyme, YaeF/YiiX, C92 family